MSARGLWLAAALFAALGSVVPGLAAQERVDPELKADPRGFHVGLALTGASLSFENGTGTDSGAGLSVRLGYAPNASFALFVQANGNTISPDDSLGDDYTLGHFDLGVRGQLWAPSRRVVPFAEVVYSGRSAETDELGSALVLSGAGLGGSLGAMVFLQPGLALDIGFTINGGSFSEVEFQGMSEEIDQGATSGRFSIGLSWFSR